MDFFERWKRESRLLKKPGILLCFGFGALAALLCILACGSDQLYLLTLHRQRLPSAFFLALWFLLWSGGCAFRRLQKPATRSAALLLCVAFHALLLYCLCQSHVLYFCTVYAFVGCGFAGVCFVGSIPAVGGSDNRTNIRTVCKSDFFAVYFCGHFFEMNGQKGKSGN